MDELKCDIAYVLQNSDLSVLQKFALECYNFRADIAAKLEGFTSYERECTEKKSMVKTKITELQSEIDKLKNELDAANLQRKQLERKIENAIKTEEELTEEVEAAKARRDGISIEIVDLHQEVQKRKEKKKSVWGAIKRACHIYDKYLDFHIHLEELNGNDYIKVSFFIHNDNTKDKYYTCMSYHDNHWRVEQIEPALKKEYLHNFKDIMDASDKYEIRDVTAFLCHLRDIFKKHYIQDAPKNALAE